MEKGVGCEKCDLTERATAYEFKDGCLGSITIRKNTVYKKSFSLDMELG